MSAYSQENEAIDQYIQNHLKNYMRSQVPSKKRYQNSNLQDSAEIIKEDFIEQKQLKSMKDNVMLAEELRIFER